MSVQGGVFKGSVQRGCPERVSRKSDQGECPGGVFRESVQLIAYSEISSIKLNLSFAQLYVV